MQIHVPRLILASTSIYRARLLEKLGVEFEQTDPDYEELSVPGESPAVKACRLADGKALSVQQDLPARRDAIVIGSDQVAHLDDRCFSKPGTHQRAFTQLSVFSGQWLSFTTAISLLDNHGARRCGCETYRIKFRNLTATEINNYLLRDHPYDCAGSIKAEASGVTLLEDTDGRDVNTLYGLPLMLLRELLLELDFSL